MIISTATFSFLSDLSRNNDREWFNSHKHRFEAAKEEIHAFSSILLPFLQELDPNIPKILKPKNIVFRIYRDIRFSKDKKPYKSHFGLWFPAHNNKESGPGYYLHIEPGKSFLGAGYWKPSTNHLRLIRQEIDYNSYMFHEIIDVFKDTFDFNWHDSLVRPPKGFDDRNPDISFIKLKSFEVVAALSDESILDSNSIENIYKMFRNTNKYVNFLNLALEQ